MKSLLKSIVAGLSLLTAVHVGSAQTTVFSYQGRLSASGAPADGTYEMTFQLFDDPMAGESVSLIQTNECAVSNGLFTTLLDFGRAPFTGQNLWLGIGVRTNGSVEAFTALSPRQYLAATPYALRAAGAGAADTVTGPVAAASLTGVLSDAVLPANLARLDEDTVFLGKVSFANSSNTFQGQFAGNADGLTNLNLGASAPPGVITTNSFILTNLTSAASGNSPAGMVLADFNGDGWPDLAVANSGTNFLTVSTNDQRGGFVVRDMPVVGDSPVNVLAGEVNDDNRPDLIVARGDGTLVLLTNDGSGLFSVVSSVTAPAPLSTMALEDFNFDGFSDVVCGFYANQPLHSLHE